MRECKENTSFFTGKKSAIDLWTISNDKKLVLYELKAKKTKKPTVGTITELMFYASYMRDMFLKNDNTWKPQPAKQDFRGYGKLYDAYSKQELSGIKAYMLVDTIHPLLQDGKVLKLMNLNNDGITYGIKQYDRDTGVICDI